MGQNKLNERITSLLKGFSRKDIIVCLASLLLVIIVVFRFCNTDDKDSTSALLTVSPSPSVQVVKSMQTDEELRLQGTLSKIDGVGNVYAFISTNSDFVPQSAIIIAQGASLPETRVKIEQAVRTALRIEAGCIKIYEMGNN